MAAAAAAGAKDEPWMRWEDQSLEGEHYRSKKDTTQKFKIINDKDGRPYAQGVRLETDKIPVVNRRLQCFDVAEMKVQTMTEEEIAGQDAQVDDRAVADFLRTVEPLMMRELGVACSSFATFEAYEPRWDDAGETCDMTLQVWKEGLVDLQVSSVAWNCTGATLACSYGRLDTLGWCESSAPVCLWNAFRPQLVNGEPDTTIEISSGFVMCLAFHPVEPGLLAGGTYNGELMLWNVASDDFDPLVASSSIDDYFHREAIQAVQWVASDVSSTKTDSYLLATVSCDGKVLLWSTKGAKKSAAAATDADGKEAPRVRKDNPLSTPSRGFTLLMSVRDDERRVLGGRSLCFSPLEPLSFAVGCESGHLLVAFRSPPGASFGKPQGKYTWRSSAVALLDQVVSQTDRLKIQTHVEAYCLSSHTKEVSAEVIFASKPDPLIIFSEPRRTDLEQHAGAVTVVAFSPFARRLLLSGAVDGSVKIYDTLSTSPVLTFYPPSKNLSTCAVSAAAWSPSRPCVFVVAMEMGGVYVYDLLKSRQEPVLELPLAASGSQKVTSLMFNPKTLRLLGVGDDRGRVRIFRLPFALSEPKKSEGRSEATFISQLLRHGGKAKKEEAN